jgi:hypothetical protein
MKKIKAEKYYIIISDKKKHKKRGGARFTKPFPSWWALFVGYLSGYRLARLKKMVVNSL